MRLTSAVECPCIKESACFVDRGCSVGVKHLKFVFKSPMWLTVFSQNSRVLKLAEDWKQGDFGVYVTLKVCD